MAHLHLHNEVHGRSDFPYLQLEQLPLQTYLISSIQALDTSGMLIHTGNYVLPFANHLEKAHVADVGQMWSRFQYGTFNMEQQGILRGSKSHEIGGESRVETIKFYWCGKYMYQSLPELEADVPLICFYDRTDPFWLH